MRLLDRIGTAWDALRGKSAPPAGSYSYGWGGGSSWSDAFRSRRAPAPAELVEGYKSLVYACVNLNAHAVARTPLRLYAVTKAGQSRPKCAVKGVGRRAGARLVGLGYAAKAIAGAERVEEVTAHPLLDAVMRVNEDLDHAQLLLYTVMSLDIVGSAYWWPSIGKYTLPEELWALPPHLVVPVFTSGTMVPDAYNFGGESYARRDLVRFRRLSAKNPYGQGYGPEQAAIEYARLEDTFVSIQDNMLSNGPRPSLLVSPKDPKGAFGPAERQRLENEMERRGRGGRAGGVFVVDGAAAITPISYSPTDLGGLEISSYDLERIANCFDVPVSMLKTEDVNRANAEAGLVQHGRNAVEPRCRLIASTLTRWTHSHDARGTRGWDRLFWAFDPVVNEDKQAEAELHRTYLDLGVISRNEVRLELGYEPADGGDALLVPGSLSRLVDVAAGPDGPPGTDASDGPGGGPGVGGDDDGPEPEDASEAGEAEETEATKALMGLTCRVLSAIEDRLAVDEPELRSGVSGTDPLGPSPPRKFNHIHEQSGRFGPAGGHPTPSGVANIEKAAAFARERGLEVDTRGYEKLRIKPGFNPETLVAVWRHSEQKILINERTSFWHDVEAEMAKSYRDRWSSTRTLHHVMLHEQGHALFQRSMSIARYTQFNLPGFFQTNLTRIAKQVSNYAMKNPNEFVAETFVGLTMGVKYGPEVVQWYHELKGPEPRW